MSSKQTDQKGLVGLGTASDGDSLKAGKSPHTDQRQYGDHGRRWRDALFLLTGSMAMRSIWERPWQSMPSSLYAIWIRRMMWSARKETVGREINVTAHMCMVFFDDKDVAYDLCRLWQRKKGLTLQAEAVTRIISHLRRESV